MDTGRKIGRALALVMPSLVGLLGDLLTRGLSPEDAAEEVNRDIQSRRERYEREKAEDEAALDAKHGRGDTDPGEPPDAE